MIGSCDMWHGLRWFPYFEIVLTESRNIKTFLKKSYAVALDSCWTFTKKMLHGLEHDVASAYGVCIYYRHYWAL